MNVYLVGFMGSGKSTLGRRLAALLNIRFIDLDKQIEHRTGKTVPEYFKQHGEEAFRLAEQEELHRTKQLHNSVIAVGGGTPCFFDNMDWMNGHGQTIYISLPPAALADRLINSKTERPLIKGLQPDELIDFIVKKLEEREPFYKKAQHIVSGVDLTAAKLASYL